MDVLTAHTPHGSLHAVTCDWPEGLNHGERFRQTQERQGCTVRRVPLAQYLAAQAGRRGGPPRVDVPDPAPPPAPGPTSLPPVGQEITLPGWGRCSVIRHLHFPSGEAVAVAAGKGVETLVRDWAPVVEPVAGEAPTGPQEPPPSRPKGHAMASLFDPASWT